MAYVKSINPNTGDSHQSSPAYVLSFIRWSVRDSKNNPESDAFQTREPLIVYSDAINVTVSSSKSSKTPTFQATLASGDINYSTALAPGDFVFVNMLDWEADAVRVVNQAQAGKPINGLKDGFKGLFKIQTPSRNMNVSPDGIKTYYYDITGAGFSEFDTTILFNPALADAFKDDAQGLFMMLVGSFYGDKLKSEVNVETLISDLYQILIGKNLRSNNVGLNNYGNLQYKIPVQVGNLLGIKATHVNEIYNLILGVWNEANTGFTPTSAKADHTNNIFHTGVKLQGDKLIAPENWNYKTVWSILNDNLNSTMNEMYTCFRTDPVRNAVMPTIIARQKPFNNLNFKNDTGIPTTAFLNLPRWRLNPDLALTFRFYKNEQLRFNFVQVYTRGLPENADEGMAQQIALKNFVQDTEDIQRHGLKPYIQSSNFDFPLHGVEKIRAKEWANIVADWVMNGQLKESGTISCMGIQENIAVGDNIEFDNVVYHIESINHTFQVMNNGNKAFRTTMNLSYGVDLRSSNDQLVYPEMQFTDRFSKGKDDWNHSKLLPGFSDSQDINGRVNGEEVKETKEASFQIPRKNRIKQDD